MSNKIDPARKDAQVYMYLAIRRNKDNEGQTSKDELCFREICRGDPAQTIRKLRSRLDKGVWRIYRSVNARDTKKATKLLQHRLLDEFDTWHYRVDSLYKKLLMQPECRATGNVLLDIDEPEYEKQVLESLKIDEYLERIQTPNGVHIVVDGLSLYCPTNVAKRDMELFSSSLPYYEVKKDALIFVELITI